MILLQDSLPRVKTAGRGERYIRLMEDYVKERATKPIAFITPTSHGQSDYSRGIRAEVPHISFLQEANKALRAIAKIVRSREREALGQQAAKETRQLSDAQIAVIASLEARAKGADQPLALNEHESKQLLRLWGVPVGEETLVQSAQEAVEAAEKIGYPVVLKAVSAKLLHKSDVGAVQLNLNDAAAVKSAFSRIEENLKAHAFSGKLEGMLVAKQAKGGIEIVLGIHRDPEVGPVVMAGAGGVLLELTKDVAFAAAPISREKALDLLTQTNVGTLLQGYRGGPKYDIEAAVQAIMALGRVAEDMSAFIHSADVNPFVIMPEGQGAVALDALMIVE